MSAHTLTDEDRASGRASRWGNLTREERFWAKVQKTSTCWLWCAGTIRAGYGWFYVGTSNPAQRGHCVQAHRFSYELHIGPIPTGKLVCHSCDNPRCVRPDHLFLGDHLANAADRDRKGRAAQPFGERSGAACLTESAVREIRARHALGDVTKRALGKVFGVCETTIARIVERTTWRHVA